MREAMPAKASRLGREPGVARLLCPFLLLAGAVALVTCGAVLHARPVLVEQDFTPPAALSAGRPPGLPWGLPAPPPSQTAQLVPIRESEAELVRDVTFGGVIRLESGELKRTYSGEAPSLCPT